MAGLYKRGKTFWVDFRIGGYHRQSDRGLILEQKKRCHNKLLSRPIDFIVGREKILAFPVDAAGEVAQNFRTDRIEQQV